MRYAWQRAPESELDLMAGSGYTDTMTYDIIATLGPATAAPADALRLLHNGANRFRLNTSHLSVTETMTWIEHLPDRANQAEARNGPHEVVLDLQGSKWRLGVFEVCVLALGDTVVLWDCSVPAAPGAAGANDAASTSRFPASSAKAAVHRLPVPHSDFFRAAADCPGTVRLNDGRVELQIEDVEPAALRCRVMTQGEISPRKGISLPGSTFRREGLSDKDQDIVRRAALLPQVSYALSYVRDAEELRVLKHAVDSVDEVGSVRGRCIIAKIERPEAVNDIEAIAQECNELWICRGDLGAELGSVAMARTVHELTGKLRRLAPPTVLAGQVLEHMTTHPEPTRSELCHLYDALKAGYAGIVLSDETAVGKHPAAACRAAAMFQS